MEIRVYVFKRGGRSNYVCQWTDPITGKTKMKSAGTAIRREADRFAARLEETLKAGRVVDPMSTLWAVLADRYENEPLSSRARATLYKFKAVRSWVEKCINPKLARSLDASEVSKLQSHMRTAGLEEATIRSSLQALRACLRWGKRLGLLADSPFIDMPERCNKAKGRPVEFTEFLKMLDCVIDVVGEPHMERMKFLLCGLWLSGLRLDEALRLTWQPTLDGFYLQRDGEAWRIKIEANADKSTEERLLPLAGDFVAFLGEVPEADQHDFVFNPTVDGQLTERMRMDTCSKVISRIGRKAGIIVAQHPPKPGTKEPRIKYASAHDLRRSFATRWADELTEEQLKDLMRHKCISTTNNFYAIHRARKAEKELQAAMLNKTDTSSDILQFRKPA
jgi:integrase